MTDFFQHYGYVAQALIATLFTWGVTAAGASIVFFTKTVNAKLMDSMLGFAAGVMIAASFWSLLSPGIEMAEQTGQIPWLTAGGGIHGGGIFMRLTDRFLPHLHLGLGRRTRGGREDVMATQYASGARNHLAQHPRRPCRGRCFRGRGGKSSVRDDRGRHCPGDRHRASEFSRRGCGLVTVEKRRDGTNKEFSYGTGFRLSRADCRSARCFFCPIYAEYSTLCSLLRGRRNDFVVVEELIPESQRKEENIDTVTMATMAGVCDDDASRCRAELKTPRSATKEFHLFVERNACSEKIVAAC